MSGNIGTGKSTTTELIRGNMTPGTYYVISNDSLIMNLTCGYHGPELYKVPWKSETEKFKLGMVRLAVMCGIHVIIDECNITRKTRMGVITAARESGECLIFVHWHAYKDGLTRRIQSDSRNQSESIWEMVHDQFAEAAEYPETEEGWDVLKVWDGLGHSEQVLRRGR